MKTWLGIPCRKMKPTKAHRPIMWECMLGTVYSMSPDGKLKYHDYRWDEAKAYAKIDSLSDLRIHKIKGNMSPGDSGYEGPRNQVVLFAVPQK